MSTSQSGSTTLWVRKTCLFWIQPEGVCTKGFSQAGADPSFTWQDSGIPTSKVYSTLTSQLPSGMVCSCMCKHLLHLCLLTGQPDSVARLYQLGILSGLGLLHTHTNQPWQASSQGKPGLQEDQQFSQIAKTLPIPKELGYHPFSCYQAHLAW